MTRKFLKISLAFLLLSFVIVCLISIKHPILRKWFFGQARFIGNPISANVYTNEQKNDSVKVYLGHAKYADGKSGRYFLIRLPESYQSSRLQYFIIDTTRLWVARASCVAIDCYDSINGWLFESEIAWRYVDFKDDMKGFDYDPELSVKDNQMKIYMPKEFPGFDSLRIQLN